MIQAQHRISFLSVVALSSVLLAACGSDDDYAANLSTRPPSSPPPSESNEAPAITGAPPPAVTQGSTYSFTPTASDAEGAALSFSVSNLPSWATFDPNTGRITGSAAAAHVGTHRDIRISVSDGRRTTVLPAFSIDVVGTATGSATLMWHPPTENLDGSPLTNLAGYRVYWGTAEGDYPNSVTLDNPGLSSFVVEQLTPATWYFALTALNSMGAESSFSNVASKTVR